MHNLYASTLSSEPPSRQRGERGERGRDARDALIFINPNIKTALIVPGAESSCSSYDFKANLKPSAAAAAARLEMEAK